MRKKSYISLEGVVVMERNFSFVDARKLLQRHQELQARLTQISKVGEQYKEVVKSATEHYVTSEVLKAMKNIPVEELNRDKHGIRVKALRDNGFETYSDILTASVYQLTAIRGISEDGARVIKKIASDASVTAHKTTKLRLSADNRTTDTTMLVTAVSQYHKARQLANSSEQLYDKYGHDIANALEDIQSSTGIFKWLFSSKEKKNKAIEAYQFLQHKLSDDYGAEVNRLADENRKLDFHSENDVWGEFQKEPIKYINTLEDITPGILGNGDAVYGLPENLARKVQDECFFPEGLLCTLRRYQEWGVKYILHQRRVLLGDEMGLGKTIQAIATMVSLKNTGATHFVVLCPASVIINWCREIQKFSKLRAIKVHGSTRGAALEEWIQSGGVAVTTYETTVYFKLPDDFRYTLLVVDEAHYIKNPEANRSVNTKAISSHADRLLFMTGTALENNVDEMVSLIDILQPDIARQISGMKMLASAPQFREKVAPVYYRRKREDVLTELPELLENEEWCQMCADEEQEYETAVLSKNFNAARRVSWNVSDLNNSSKAKRMLEIIEEAKTEDRKVIVFSFYLDTIRKISDMLGNRCTEPINGSVSPSRRQEIIDEFDKASVGQVLAAQIIAGGTGLNIQSASVVILCEPQLKPSIENQAISRAYRMGQARNVLVYRLLCDNTIDERITDLLAEKQAVFDAFADKSVAAQNVEVDSKTLGGIIQEEIDRINQKREGYEIVTKQEDSV